MHLEYDTFLTTGHDIWTEKPPLHFSGMVPSLYSICTYTPFAANAVHCLRPLHGEDILKPDS